jgi:ubiquinone/menaquinone biosynthesis C-methylase UbiE
MSEEAVKGYYIGTERYDWVVDTKYPEKFFHILRERAIVNNIKKYARGRVGLDLGCGTGLITRHIDLEYTVGLDLNLWAIAKAGSHVKKGVQFVVGDAENLPLASDTFDVVVCTDVLEHLLEPQKAVSDIFRVLKTGGVLVGTVPSKNLVWKYRKAITTTCPVCEPFHNNFSKREVKILLRDFDIMRINRGALGLEWLFAVRKTSPGRG